MNKYPLFVYGTLKRGYTLHEYYLQQAEFVGVDKVNGMMYTLGSYPIFFADGIDKIVGEVYNITQETLDILNIMEGNAGYKLEKIETIKGRNVFIFVYQNKEIANQLIRITNF